MTDLRAAMRRLEGDIADSAIDNLTMASSLPGPATWPPEHLTLNDEPDAPLVVMLEGQLVEVQLDVHVIRWCPPGWPKAPDFSKGDIVMVSGPTEHRWVVREVLGTKDDPRPGYVLDFVTSLDPFDHRDTGRIALPSEVFWPVQPSPDATGPE